MHQEPLPIGNPETIERDRMVSYAQHEARRAPFAFGGSASELASALDLVAPAAHYGVRFGRAGVLSGEPESTWQRHPAITEKKRAPGAALWAALPPVVRRLAGVDVSGLVVAGLLRRFDVDHPALHVAPDFARYQQEPGSVLRDVGASVGSALRDYTTPRGFRPDDTGGAPPVRPGDLVSLGVVPDSAAVVVSLGGDPGPFVGSAEDARRSWLVQLLDGATLKHSRERAMRIRLGVWRWDGKARRWSVSLVPNPAADWEAEPEGQLPRVRPVNQIVSLWSLVVQLGTAPTRETLPPAEAE